MGHDKGRGAREGESGQVTTYYLSGPMRGKPNHNYPLFYEAETALIEFLVGDGFASHDEGWEILNPARNFEGDTTKDTTTYMQADMAMVLGSDVLVLLPHWRESEGARREVQLGIWTGKRFMQAVRNDFEVEGDGFLSFHNIPTPTLEETPSPRASALDEAKQLITGDRNNQYGPPTQDFQRSADALNAYGYRGPDGRPLQAHDIAIMVMSVKLSRLMWTPEKRDHWVDIAGYAGCGYECAVEEAKANG